MKRMLFLLLVAATPAFADSKIGGKTVECYCTGSQGERFEMEQETCLVVDGRAYMARCEMSLNVPIWRDTGRSCLSSSLESLSQSITPSG